MTIVIALVFCGTLFVLFSTQPEQRIAYSEDGQVRLEYLAEAGRYLTVDTLAGVIPSTQNPLLASPFERGRDAYTVDTNDYVFTQSATLIFSYDHINPEVHIAAFDQQTQEWQILATEYDSENAELSTQVDKVAQWALIQYNGDAEN